MSLYASSRGNMIIPCEQKVEELGENIIKLNQELSEVRSNSVLTVVKLNEEIARLKRAKGTLLFTLDAVKDIIAFNYPKTARMIDEALADAKEGEL